jgi:hypothetical protein
MTQRYRPALILAAAALAGCGASATTAARSSPVATVTASPSGAPGCAQAAAAVLAARERINAQDYAGAVTRISDLRDTLPRGKLQADAALAATDLAFLSYDAASGNPAYQAIKDVHAALDKIDADCGT